MFNAKRLFNFLATGEMPEMTALDETLAEHDAKYHPDGFKDGDSCKFRAERAKVDGVDLVDGDGKVKGQRSEVRLRTGSVSDLSAADRAALNEVHRILTHDRMIANWTIDAYSDWSGDSKYFFEDKPKQIPDEVLRWCEDTYVRALGNLDKLDRAKKDYKDDVLFLNVIKAQAARDILERGNADEKMMRKARVEIANNELRRLMWRSQSEAEGSWTEDPNDRTNVNAQRLDYIKSRFDKGLGKSKDGLWLKDRKEAIFKTLDNAPYEVVLNFCLSKPDFAFVEGDVGSSTDSQFITIGFSKWSFTSETLSHELGHSVLNHQGQDSVEEIMQKYKPIVEALDADYAALNLPKLGQSMRNGENITSSQTTSLLKLVKHIAIRRHLDEPIVDEDEMFDMKLADGMNLTEDEQREYVCISDTLCAATNGVYFCGHSRRYYQSGAAMPLHETVANATAALVMGWKTFPKVFPRTFAAVKKIVYGME